MDEVKRFSFNAVILDPGGPGAYVEVPFDVEAAFGKKRVKICALIEGEPYRGSIVRMGGPCHILIILKEIRHKIGKGIGDTISVTLWEDAEVRVIDIPPELGTLFTTQAGALEAFRARSYTWQREAAKKITSAKQPETRQRRAAGILQELTGKMGNNDEL